jgi:hypothetical protein
VRTGSPSKTKASSSGTQRHTSEEIVGTGAITPEGEQA